MDRLGDKHVEDTAQIHKIGRRSAQKDLTQYYSPWVTSLRGGALFGGGTRKP